MPLLRGSQGYRVVSVTACCPEAKRAGCTGAILMGLKFETIIDEAALAWNQAAPE